MGRGLRRTELGVKGRSLRLLALTAFISGLWCIHYGRTSVGAWTLPIDYYGDTLGHSLAYLKAAGDRHVTPFGLLVVPELGAPFGANWNDFPRQHKLQFLMAGELARTIGLFPAANALLLLAHVLAGLSFYVVARYFRATWEWSMAGACVFAFSPFLLYRSLAHLNLAFNWPVPLGILVVTWCFSRRGLRPGSRRFWWAVAVAALTGLHHMYYVAFLAQFLVLASLWQLLRRRRQGAALSPLLLLIVLSLSAAADNASTFVYAWRQGPNPASVFRPYGNIERFALKPIELVLPPEGSGLAPWRDLASVYYHGAIYRGEMGSAYLGLAGIAALLWLAVVAMRRAQGWPPRRVPSTAFALLWIFAFSIVGGLNAIVGAIGFVWLRATNRFSIWILVLVLLWAVVRLSRASWTRHRRLSVSVAALATALALADQLPPGVRAGDLQNLERVIASDHAFVRSLEALVPEGAMLFQLPVMDCPEGKPARKTMPHEHLRPYLHSAHLRFSYGSDKGRPREDWQRRVEELEAEPMVDALERMGFAGLLVIRKAYADGAQELRDRLAATGRQEAFESADRDFLFVRLQPDPSPRPPDEVAPPATGSERS